MRAKSAIKQAPSPVRSRYVTAGDYSSINPGFFGLNASNLADLEVIIENGDGLGIEDSFNNTLAPYNITIGDTYLRAVWDPIYLANATTRLQQYVAGLNLTTELVYGMQSLCAYETVALGYSNFCSLFTKEEWQGYEYDLDLQFQGEYCLVEEGEAC